MKKETDQKQMANYLEIFQMWERMLLGVAHVTVETIAGGNKEASSVTMHVFPADKDGQHLRDEKGDVILHSFKVYNFIDDKSNKEEMKKAAAYIKKFKLS